MEISEFFIKLYKLKVRIKLVGEELDIEIPKDQFTKELVDEIRSKKEELITFLAKEEKRLNHISISKANLKDYYPLSSAQKRLYLLQEMDMDSTAYNMPHIIPLGSEVNKAKIEQVLLQLILRHESFRTSFEKVDEAPVQRIYQQVDFKIEEFTTEKSDDPDIQNQFIRPFYLSKVPLLRAAVVNIKGKGSLLMIDMHHIISDGISHSILEREFKSLYLGEELLPLSLQYKDYSEWQNSEEQQSRVKKQEDYWKRKFEGEIPVLNLPVDYVRPVMQSAEGATVSFAFSKEETQHIKSLAKENDMTLYMSVLSAFNILLSKISGQEDIIVGTPIAGRNHRDLENIVGMFVNTLALRNEINGSNTLKEFIKKLKQSTFEAFENQDYQFEELVENISIERDISRNPLFDVMFSFENQSADIRADLSGQERDQYVHISGLSKFDLTLAAVDYGEQLFLSFEYCTKLFKAETIERFIRYFKQIVTQISLNPRRKLSELEIISAVEKQQLLYDFNDTKVSYPSHKSIPQVFEEQVKEFSKKIALEDKDKSYTYQELDEESNKIANYLIKRGVTENQLVGLMSGRLSDMIIGILGILKTGGAYVPIDPTYPEERVNQLIEDSGINIMLSTEQIDFECNLSGGIIHIRDKEIKESSTGFSLPSITSSNIAYVMYTSGSTGTPKGVVIEQKSVLRLVQNNQFFPFHSEQKILLTGAPVFDATTFEIWGALLNGGSLYIASNDVIINAELLDESIRKNSITSLWLTSSLFNQLVDQDESIFDTLKYLLVGGDVLSVKHINKIKSRNSELVLINGYGPTENTTFSTTFKIEKEYESNIPIGKPISNSTAYIFDKSNRLQAVGVSGELLVGGDGLAREYLNNPELTREKFIENPFKEGERLYRTGDLARWLPNGDIEFLGRIDHQVKIRGFRIELGEIENVLLKHGSIKECVVLAREENGDKYLCAYLVTGEDYNEEEIRSYLSASLPDYMIPSYFVAMDEIPLTPNGKVNRKALPSPEIKAGDNYVAPSNATEEKLVEIWSEVLNIEKEEISTTANFFSIGGHSLKASVLTGRIHKEIGVEFPLRDVFVHSNIKAQASQIEISTKKDFVSISKAKIQDYYPLSSAQKRLYLLQQMDLESTAYNMPYIIPLGAEVEKEKIAEVFRQLIKRHESFRTSFEIEGEEPVQHIHEEVNFRIEEISIEKNEIEAYRQQFIQAFDLRKAPLLRVSKVDIKGEGSLLMIDMHHIISDGVSHAILEQDFEGLYSGEELSELNLQYKDYSEWQNSEEQQIKVKEQEDYWKRKFEEEIPVLNLPIDKVRPAIQSHEGANVSFVLSKEETQHIKSLAKENDLTLYMSVLSVLNILLSKLSGQEDIIVGTPIAGRNHRDLENIVGMFVNTLAIRNEVNGSKTLKEFTKKLKQSTLEAFENQDYQFEELVENISIERDISRNPLFDVMFNFQNRSADTRADLSGQERDQYVHRSGLSKFDLTLSAVDYGEQMMLSFEYCTKLFKAETIERYIRYFKQIVNQLTINSERELSAIEIISAEEKQQLLYDFNDIKIDYPKEKTIYELFEDQVEKSPDNIALVYDDKNLTFDELNKYSNHYALNLLDQGAKGGEIIGIIQERSLNMIIGILAILKAGCTYCPINPETPQKRIQFILKECNIKLLISEPELVKNDPELSNINCITLNSDNIQNIQVGIDQVLQSRRSKDIISAYIIFTSGSTGNPKGVIINHSNIFPLLYWGFNYLRLDKHDKVIQNLAFYFDWSVWEIFISLTSGSSLELVSKETILDEEQYNRQINKKCITAIHITPTQFQSLTTNNKKLNTIQHLCIGAEKLTLNLVQRSYEVVSKDCIVYNMYGPTEASIMSAVLTIIKSEERTYESLSSIPIGTPIAQGGLVILNQYMQIQPVNIAGELYISGEGLSIGYINDPEKTSNSFIKNIYKTEGIKGEYLYKTGDLARWLPDGNVEFLGRIDHQVKIRGFRIELGEIENVLLKHENIKESVVIDIEANGEKYLCAYLVTVEDFNEEKIRIYLSESLPDYMIPSYFVELDSLPLNSNGKVNRKALPSPEIKAGNDYVAPSNETEEKLVQIWSEVLNIEKEEISTVANFFSIGGHSLKASVLTGRIHKETGVEFPLRDVFVHSNIKAQASQIEISTKKDFVSISKAKIRDYYPLSSAQKRLYLLQQMDLVSTAYNMPYIIPLGAEVEKEKIAEVFRQLIKRHESFRTSFEIVDEEPVQRIHEQVEFKIEELTITKEEVENQRQQFIQAFDLSKAPLLRAAIVNIKGESSLLMIDMHHIISDGASHAILEQDFQGLYSGEGLPPLSLQYKDYSEWQNSKEQQIKVKEQEEYWIRKFEGEIPVLNLPIDKVRPTIQSNEGASVSFALSKKGTHHIKSLAKETGLTLYMYVLSVFNILLSKLSGQEDVIIGTPIAGRNHSDLENIVGMFVNTLAIRNEVNGRVSLREFIGELKQTTLETFENQDYQFEDLVEKVSVERDISRNPLFDVMFNFLNHADYSGDLSDLGNNQYVHTPGISKFDLSLTAVDYGDQLFLSFVYCTKLFKPESIERYIGYFKQIINQLPDKIDEQISAIEIITELEKQQLLYDFNDTQVDYPKDKCIHQLFEEQVARTPEGVALVFNNTELTYHELNQRSNQLSHFLVSKGIKPGNIVSIMLDRSIEMIVGIISILKAGGAYCPIDINNPVQRKIYILKDSESALLLTRSRLLGDLDYEGEIVYADDFTKLPNSDDNLEVIITPKNLAYLIYTSGTTGKPKGVMIRHDGVVNTISWYAQRYRLSPGERLLQLSNYSFDASVNQIFGTLIGGASLYIIEDNALLDLSSLYLYLGTNNITVINSVPAILEELISNKQRLPFLQRIISGGENLSNQLKDKIINLGYELHNHYGPTECTIVVLAEECSEREVTLGKPKQNIQTYILSGSHDQLQPIGVKGELCISGEGISPGYLNNEALTKEKFIAHPFKEGERLYRTGDLARWLPDGNIEFLGRIDHQVKIRGFRIELGEIENVLEKHENIKESVVLAREENGDKYLCAYLVIEENFNEEEIRIYLSASQPDYMIPSYFVELEKLPLTSNGKINRKALPSPEIKAGNDYVAPSNETEEKLAQIWSKVLNIEKEKISTTANFFTIGGHSLKASILTGRIHKEIGVEFPLRNVFVHSSIKAQAGQIEISTKKDFVSIPKAKEQDFYALSSAQKRLYLLQQMDLNSTVYNMPYTITLGSEVDKEKIAEVFRQLISRHESFRTSFEIEGEEPVQRIHEQVEFKLEEFTFEKEDNQNIRSQFIQAFDLSQAPLLRVAIVNIKGEGSLLMIDMHHIISDGVSHAILEQDFQRLYSGEDLSELSLKYKDYSQWQNSEEQQIKVKDQEDYWIRKFEGETPVLDLPVDYVRPAIQSHEGASVSFALSKEETQNIKSLAKENGLTLYMSVLSAFNILLSKLSGQEDVIIGTPIAGRNHSDLENIVGIFVNTLAIRNEVNGRVSLRDFIRKLKQTTLEAYENQDYQFEDLVEKVSVERDISRNPLFDVMFNFLNHADYSGDISDLGNSHYVHTPSISKFDLGLSTVDYSDQLLLSFVYCTHLFKPESIERYIGYFKQIINQLPESLDKELSNLEILSSEEKQQLLHEFNNTTSDYPREKTIHQLFEEQVVRTPKGIALVYKNTELTYQELNQRSNQLSHYLIFKGLKPGNIVSIMLDRSIEMIVGILSVLKSGGAYCPIDIKNPVERKIYIFKDSESRLLLTKSRLLGDLEYEGEIVYADDFGKLPNSDDNLEAILTPKNLAYLIYTSGTTGKPKGVMIRHDGVVNTISWYAQRYRLSTGERLLQLSNYSFDASVNQIFGTLTGGASLYIIEESELLDLSSLYSYLGTHKITVINSVPAILEELISNRQRLPFLQRIISGGENLSNQLKDKIINLGYELHNHYGPTEGTIVVLAEKCSEKDVTLGKPKQNTQTYILSASNDHLQPIGVKGELCISGEGISPGYLNNEVLTKEKFIAHPFHEGERLYRTGDLARRLPNGNIEFLGRIDHQVKIRGFRIELGEIESLLQRYDQVNESVVIDIEDEKGDKYLCAYIVIEENFNQEELRTYLSKILPDYMIPSYFIKLEKLPLTSNGKVNRKALPSPVVKAGDDYVAPSNKIEERLVNIWSEVLNIPRKEISTNANFFTIGGQSMKASVLVSRINKELKVEFPLIEIFINPTIFKSANFIRSKKINSKEEDDHLVLLKEGNIDGDNVFLIHDSSGEVNSYVEFCKHSNDGINYWGVKADNLKNIEPVNITIKELASIYIKSIKKVCENGGFNIIGYSLGGVIAFEMVRQLEQKKGKVNFLGILDSSRYMEGFDYVKEFSIELDLIFIKKYMDSEIIKRIEHKESLKELWENISNYFTCNTENVVEIFKSVYNELDIEFLSKNTVEEKIRFFNFSRSLVRAFKKYNPENAIKSKIICFSADNSSSNLIEQWQILSSEELKEIEIPGDHYSIVKNPNVKNLYEQFINCFISAN